MFQCTDESLNGWCGATLLLLDIRRKGLSRKTIWVIGIVDVITVFWWLTARSVGVIDNDWSEVGRDCRIIERAFAMELRCEMSRHHDVVNKDCSHCGHSIDRWGRSFTCDTAYLCCALP